MNITISDPTPEPEMPVMWVVASPRANIQCGWALMPWGHLEKSAREDHANTPGSRLIRIDPNAPSFEPGPTEWVDSEGWSCSVDTVVKVRSLNTRTDIGRVISALVTKWYEAKDGT